MPGWGRSTSSYNAGIDLLNSGSYAEAVVPLQRAVKSSPHWAEALNAIDIRPKFGIG